VVDVSSSGNALEDKIDSEVKTSDSEHGHPIAAGPTRPGLPCECDALRVAIGERASGGLIHHSDRCVQ
jgi:hypothetical protein